jgi:hypothetical protein
MIGLGVGDLGIIVGRLVMWKGDDNLIVAICGYKMMVSI